MPPSTESLINDIVLSTRRKFINDSRNQIETIFTYQKYPFMNDMMGPDRVKEKGGRGLIFEIQLANDNSASFRDMFGQDTYNVSSTMSEGTERWGRVNNNWTFDVDELFQNADNEVRVINLLNARRLASMKGRADLLERSFWAVLPDPTDKKSILGVEYWLPSGTYDTFGWTGKNPTGYSLTGGIDASVDAGAGWRSWFAGGSGYFSDYNEELVDTMILAFDEIAFEGPMLVTDLVSNPSLKKFTIVMNRQTRAGLVKLQRHANDQIGPELNYFNGTISFNGIPLQRVPVLDDDDTDPIYFLNRNKFKVHTLKGSDNREEGPEKMPGRHTVRVVDQDTTCQAVCINRHEQGKIAKDAA